MNDAVWKFRSYEDASLEYAGINKHKNENVGLYSTTISSKEFYEKLYETSPQINTCCF